METNEHIRTRLNARDTVVERTLRIPENRWPKKFTNGSYRKEGRMTDIGDHGIKT